MPQYKVLVGTNAPDPSGRRDEKGKPVEVRFEAGDVVAESSISSSALKALVAQGAFVAHEGEPEAPSTFTASVSIDPPFIAAADKAKK